MVRNRDGRPKGFAYVEFVHEVHDIVHEDVSLLERCPHFRGCYVYRLQWSWDLKMCPY